MIFSKQGLLKSVLYGLIAGLFLAALFKLIEYATSFKVYTLLLNVDYIPYINTFILPEFIEVSLHLIVSVALAICLYLLIIFTNILSPIKIIFLCMFVCFFIGAALFPTTALSTRTPPVTSLPSFSYWILGHIMYGAILGMLFVRSQSVD